MPNNNQILQTLIMVSEMIAKTFGENCEVVIHDLATCEIVAIFNPEVTGRKIGDKNSETICTYLKSMNHTTNEMIAYPSKVSFKGENMKSSTLSIPDAEGTPIYTICINFDTKDFIYAERALEAIKGFVSTQPFQFVEDVPPHKPISEQHINEYTMQLISTIMQNYARPFNLNSKPARLKLLEELNQKGIFTVRDSVSVVCDMLGISQASLYVYLREIKNSKK